MKKGFSLVELSFVLVVIGFILGAIMFGVNLINLSKVRSDISKVKKFQSATALYYSVYGDLPLDGRINNCYFDFRQSYAPYLVDEDYVIKSAETETYFGVYRMVVDNGSYSSGYCGDSSLKNYVNDKVALTASLKDNDNYTINEYLMPSVLVCNIEIILDDKSLKTGYGRGGSIETKRLDLITAAHYDNCGTFTDKLSGYKDSNVISYSFILLEVN